MARPNIMKPEHDREIIRRRDRGESKRSIARALGYSDRSIARRIALIEESGVRISPEDSEPVCSLEEALRELNDFYGSEAEREARSRPRRGDLYECEEDLTPGTEGYIESFQS